MSLDHAQSSLKNLIANVDAGDIDGGKAALSALKVRDHPTRITQHALKMCLNHCTKWILTNMHGCPIFHQQ